MVRLGKFLFFFALLIPVWGEDLERNEPAKLKELRQKWIAASEKSTQKIEQKYRSDLKNLENTMVKATRIVEAQLVREESKRLDHENSANASKQNEKEPAELTSLRSNFDTRIKEVHRRMDLTYLDALKKMLRDFSAKGELDPSVAIQNEISLLEQKLKIQAPKSDIPWNLPDNAVEFENHYYSAFKAGVSWKQAQLKCKKLGGHLVTINNKHEQKFVRELAISEKIVQIWIGMYLDSETKTFKWVTGEPIEFEAWRDGEPNHSIAKREEDSVMLHPTYWHGKWADTSGKRDFGFICEWSR